LIFQMFCKFAKDTSKLARVKKMARLQISMIQKVSYKGLQVIFIGVLHRYLHICNVFSF
jgi:hypothetical protein